MIKEEYVSFEVAKLLKDKGFDQKCSKFLHVGLGLYTHTPEEVIPKGADILEIPTQAIAMRWLREIHNIHIELNWNKGNKLYSFNIWKPWKYKPEISSLDLWRIYKDDNYLGEWDYEEACETAIKYCLENFIK